jgi:hypothetical protein
MYAVRIKRPVLPLSHHYFGGAVELARQLVDLADDLDLWRLVILAFVTLFAFRFRLLVCSHSLSSIVVTTAKLTNNSRNAQGAYGLCIEGLSTSLLVSPVPDTWLRVKLKQHVGASPSEHSTYGDDTIDLSFESGWGVRLLREPATATFLVTDHVGDDELVHPYLAPAAMHFAEWLGHAAFHGGAFVHDGRAFGVLAERTGGKSTTLARLADNGVPVLVDDVLIVANGTALAGPRCIDLRPEAAHHRSLSSVRSDERRRLTLPPIEASFPLAGIFTLGWSDALSIERLQPSDRLVALARHCRPEVARTPALLEASQLPVWRVTRPLDLASLDEVCDRLLETTLG